MIAYIGLGIAAFGFLFAAVAFIRGMAAVLNPVTDRILNFAFEGDQVAKTIDWPKAVRMALWGVLGWFIILPIGGGIYFASF